MIVYETAGLRPEAGDSPGAQEALTLAAKAIHEARVTIGISDWAACDQIERKALAAAGRILDVEQAIRVGRAAQGQESLVRAEIDGGRSFDADLIHSAVAMVKGMLESRHGEG